MTTTGAERTATTDGDTTVTTKTGAKTTTKAGTKTITKTGTSATTKTGTTAAETTGTAEAETAGTTEAETAGTTEAETAATIEDEISATIEDNTIERPPIDVPPLDLDFESTDTPSSPRRVRVSVRFSTPEMPSGRSDRTFTTRASRASSVTGSMSPYRPQRRVSPLDPYAERPRYPVISTPSEDSIPSVDARPQRSQLPSSRVSNISGRSNFDFPHRFDSKQDRREKAMAARAERTMETPPENEAESLISRYKLRAKFAQTISTGRLLFWISASVLSTVQVHLAQTYSDMPLKQCPYEFFISVAVIMLMNFGMTNGYWQLIAPYMIFSFHNFCFLSVPDFICLLDKLDEHDPRGPFRKFLTAFSFAICALRLVIVVEVLRIFCYRWFLWMFKMIVENRARSDVPKLANVSLESETPEGEVRNANETNKEYRLAESMSDTERQIDELREKYYTNPMPDPNDVVDEAVRRCAAMSAAEADRDFADNLRTTDDTFLQEPSMDPTDTYEEPEFRSESLEAFRTRAWTHPSTSSSTVNQSRASTASLYSRSEPSEADSTDFQSATAIPAYRTAPGTAPIYNEYYHPRGQSRTMIPDRERVAHVAEHQLYSDLPMDEDEFANDDHVPRNYQNRYDNETYFDDQIPNDDNIPDNDNAPNYDKTRIPSCSGNRPSRSSLHGGTTLRSSLSYTVKKKWSDESDYQDAQEQ